MPPLARYHIKAGLFHFAFALILGVVLAAQPVFNLSPYIATLRPAFLHLLMVGWITQLIMGVAYWMFPKQSKEQPRGSSRLGWAVFISLNVGILLRLVGEPLLFIQPGPVGGVVLTLSAVLQVIAGWLFVINTWSRVKER